jgi:hypothetical protein
MSDIFGYNRNPKPQGVFSSSESYLKFGAASSGAVNDASSLLGALVQNWNVAYQNNVTEIFELGSSSIYWVKGRPTGSGSIARIIGFKNVLLFPAAAYDACLGGVTMEIEAQPGACPDFLSSIVDISLGGAIVTQIGFDANVADTRINENIAFRFATMQVTETNGGSSVQLGAK